MAKARILALQALLLAPVSRYLFVMADDPDALGLFQSATRRRIGKACAREGCELSELARRLRRPTQGLNSVVDGMVKDELLEKQGTGRGAKYILRPDRLPLLES